VCSACTDPCLECGTTATECTKCHPWDTDGSNGAKALRSDNTCADCPAGKWEDYTVDGTNDNPICSDCNKPCSECGATGDECTKCEDTLADYVEDSVYLDDDSVSGTY
jgi:hypothetical protein